MKEMALAEPFQASLRDATPSGFDRGLKSTATVIRSLRDCKILRCAVVHLKEILTIDTGGWQE